MTKHLLSSNNREFRSLLDKCADTDHLTVFVGAGCSAEVGLPTWKNLVDRYLGVAIELKLQDANPDSDDFKDREAVIRELKDAFVEAPRTAMIGDMLLGEKRKRSALRLALYNQVGSLEPGPTALAVALLYRERLKKGLITTLVTTNYDDLLEAALEQVGFPRKVIRPRTLEDLPEDSDIADVLLDKYKRVASGKRIYVWHLHGFMPFESEQVTREPIVFSEKDYSLYNLAAVDSIASLFDVGSCLFTGMSLVDFDIATAAFSATQLVRNDKKAQRRLSDVDHFAISLDRSEQRSISARLGSARLDSMGIHPLNGVSTFAQVPQVLHELVMRVRMGERYWDSKKRYGERLRRWSRDHDTAHRPLRAKGSFFQAQVELAERLAEDLTKLQRKTGTASIGDSLGLHIWKRDPRNHAMSMWISTEYARRSSQSPGSSGSISLDSRFCAVRTAAHGVPSSQFEQIGPVNSSRWMQSLGVPVVTEPDSRYGRLLVGVITLSSDLGQKESELGQMLVSDPTLVSSIERKMRKLGQRYLVP